MGPTFFLKNLILGNKVRDLGVSYFLVQNQDVRDGVFFLEKGSYDSFIHLN